MALSFVDIYQPSVTRKEVERDTITEEQIAQHKTAQQKCQGYNVMTCNNPRCLGNYNFDHIVFFCEEAVCRRARYGHIIGGGRIRARKRRDCVGLLAGYRR